MSRELAEQAFAPLLAESSAFKKVKRRTLKVNQSIKHIRFRILAIYSAEICGWHTLP